MLDPDSLPVYVGPSGASFNSGASYFHNISPSRLYDSRPGIGFTVPPNGGFTLGGNGLLDKSGRWPVPIRPDNAHPAAYVPGLPSGVTAILANVSVENAQGDGFVSINDGTATDSTIGVKWYPNGAGQVGNFAIISVDNAGWFDLYGGSYNRIVNGNPTTVGGRANIIIDVFGYVDNDATNGGYYKPITGSNFRLYDSRTDNNNTAPLGRDGALLNNGTARNVQVTGNLDIPSSAKAVIANVTAVHTRFGGFFTLFPANLASPPGTASLNWVDSTTGNIPHDVGNLAIVPLDSSGRMKIKADGNNAGSGADFTIDVQGYIDAVSSNVKYYPLTTPQRLYSTDDDNIPMRLDGEVHTQFVWNKAQIPSGAQAVVVHITTIDVSGGGFLALYPQEALLWPGHSNVNTNRSGQEIGNLAIVPINQGTGQITIWNGGAGKGFILDVIGYSKDPGQDGTYITCPGSANCRMWSRAELADRSASNGHGDYTAVHSAIDNANPTIRDDEFNGTSHAVLWIGKIEHTYNNRSWVEVGWQKVGQFVSTNGRLYAGKPVLYYQFWVDNQQRGGKCIPDSTTGCRTIDANGMLNHDFRAEYLSSDQKWHVYIDNQDVDSMSASVLGFERGAIHVGGEVTDLDGETQPVETRRHNEMGITYFNQLTYKIFLNGQNQGYFSWPNSWFKVDKLNNINIGSPNYNIFEYNGNNHDLKLLGYT